MIIKSMSRKSKSFSQLYDYLMRDKDNFSFTRNLYSNSKDKESVIREFMQNSDFINKSRGKNFLYHELLSLENNDLTINRQKEILYDLANQYLSKRADNHLSFGVIHEDKDHIHLHLMISSNEIQGNKRVRLSKQELLTIQKTIENYKNKHYIELSKSSFYQEKKNLEKETQKEQEIKHKRKSQTIKEQIKNDLKNTFQKATSKTYLDNHLKNLGYELYLRGKSFGVTYDSKNYRLKTLGLEKEYLQVLNKLEKIKDREIRRDRNKQDRSFER